MIRIPHLLLRDTGLTKESAADAFQVKSVSLERFATELGRLRHELMLEITDAIALCVGFSPK
jgi:mRNA interferase MazF